MNNKVSLRERIRENLVQAMENAGINQVQLAEKLNISKGTVNNWTRGNNSPDVDMVPKICEVLGISIVSLYSPCLSEQSNSLTSISNEALKLAHDYEMLDDRGRSMVRGLADMEMKYTAKRTEKKLKRKMKKPRFQKKSRFMLQRYIISR